MRFPAIRIRCSAIHPTPNIQNRQFRIQWPAHHADQVGVTAFDNNMPTMYAEHYSLDTQTDLGSQFIFTLGLPGQLRRHTYFHYDANAVASVQGIPLNPAGQRRELLRQRRPYATTTRCWPG